MKPRWDSLPWTEEDKSIYFRVWGRLHVKLYYSIESDRRDADLMLMLREGGCPACLGQFRHSAECIWWFKGLIRAAEAHPLYDV